MTDVSAAQAAQQITVRSVHDTTEMLACVNLQQRVWGYTELDTVPDQIFIVAAKTGGQVLAAYADDTPVGFALAFAAVRDGQTYLHSHMVGVIEAFQNRGVGRLLKLAQREDALTRGFQRIEWTFDPLQLKNAFFNIERLGAIVRRYMPNLYGRTTSPLHAGLPTDRLVAEWWLSSPRVAATVRNGLAPRGEASAACVSVSVPASIRDICTDDPSTAEKIQLSLREQFTHHFAAGLAVNGFESNEHRASYVLEPYED